MTFDNSSVNYSRFCKLYGTVCFHSVLAKPENLRLRRADKPLRRADKPLRRADKPLRRPDKPLRRADKPLRRASKPLRRANQSLRRSNQSLRRSNHSLRRSIGCRWSTNQSFQSSQNTSKKENGYQQSSKSAVSQNINYKMSHYKCASRNKCRLSARQLTKQPHVKRSRDREPSRLPLKKIVLALRKRKNRSFLKHYF